MFGATICLRLPVKQRQGRDIPNPGRYANLAVMKTLIITGDVASAGCLKAAGRADATFGLWPRLIVGPTPDDETVSRIFGPQDTSFDDDALNRRGPILFRGKRTFPGSTQGLKAICENFDRIELWFDPDAESQLALSLLLDYLQTDPTLIRKLTLVYPDAIVAEMKPEYAASLRPTRQAVTKAHLSLSAHVWAAWRHTTPHGMASLLDQDLSALPYIKDNVLRLLNELPNLRNGLTTSEALLLELVGEDEANAIRVLSRYQQDFWPKTYRGFDTGQLLDDLGNAADPAILGLPPGPYDLALMDDAARRDWYLSSPLTLSPFGKEMLAGRADFGEGGPSPRWWGGTLLTSERQWRWDAANRRLHGSA
jgi:hypothetical protein